MRDFPEDQTEYLQQKSRDIKTTNILSQMIQFSNNDKHDATFTHQNISRAKSATVRSARNVTHLLVN